MREGVRYGLAVLGYIGLAMLAKRFLTWTSGPIYFVVVLEALPRAVARVRRRWPRVVQLQPEAGEP
jgi:hypothetical protein